MATKETWDNYSGRTGEDVVRCIIKTDEEVVLMLEDVITTIHTLERMYGTQGAQLTVRALLLDYSVLTSCALNRNIKNYPTLIR